MRKNYFERHICEELNCLVKMVIANTLLLAPEKFVRGIPV